MKEYNIKEMEVYEAVIDRGLGFCFCYVYQDFGETGTCGKECEKYKPRNGKSGICKYYGPIYEHGKKNNIEGEVMNLSEKLINVVYLIKNPTKLKEHEIGFKRLSSELSNRLLSWSADAERLESDREKLLKICNKFIAMSIEEFEGHVYPQDDWIILFNEFCAIVSEIEKGVK